jgi:hypothetical protein
VALRSIRPVSLARFWRATPEDTVELFLAAQRLGIMVMGWDLLCPRCRGAKARVKHLHELPQGAHCSSCNVDYGRDFTRNVELTFHPEPWLRPLPEGELCLLGQGTTPHVKFHAEAAAHTRKSFPMAAAPTPVQHCVRDRRVARTRRKIRRQIYRLELKPGFLDGDKSQIVAANGRLVTSSHAPAAVLFCDFRLKTFG